MEHPIPTFLLNKFLQMEYTLVDSHLHKEDYIIAFGEANVPSCVVLVNGPLSTPDAGTLSFISIEYCMQYERKARRNLLQCESIKIAGKFESYMEFRTNSPTVTVYRLQKT
jgi:hypothetical protein